MSIAKARELAVLSILNAHAAYGYQIAAAFDKGPQRLLGLKKSAVYAILERFKKRGWIAETSDKPGLYPERRLCTITEAGNSALEELMDSNFDVPHVSLLSLVMAHESGLDVDDRLRKHLEQRSSLLKGLQEDQDHASSSSMRFAEGLLRLEMEIINNCLDS